MELREVAAELARRPARSARCRGSRPRARAGSWRSNRTPRCRPDRDASSGASRVEEGRELARRAGRQRDLHEHERLVGHRGVEERVAPAIGVEPVLEVGPRLDRVHRFVLDQLLEQRGRRVPRDAPELEQADVEQRRELRLQLVVEIGERDRRRRWRSSGPAASRNSSARRSTRNFTPSSRPVKSRGAAADGGERGCGAPVRRPPAHLVRPRRRCEPRSPDRPCAGSVQKSRGSSVRNRTLPRSESEL